MIDKSKYEERLRTTMDYMNGFHNGDWNEEFKSCPHCDEKEWPDSSCSCGYGRIPDILMHVQWSHDELFGPLHETASDLLTEVQRLREENELMVTYLRYMRDGELADKDWLSVNDLIGDEE
tara:strand:- start:18 stop:380 length:363 start_codon:yes stop_codon:yes gene_type:complete